MPSLIHQSSDVGRLVEIAATVFPYRPEVLNPDREPTALHGSATNPWELCADADQETENGDDQHDRGRPQSDHPSCVVAITSGSFNITSGSFNITSGDGLGQSGDIGLVFSLHRLHALLQGGQLLGQFHSARVAHVRRVADMCEIVE